MVIGVHKSAIMTDGIGTLNEQPLHSALKDAYDKGAGFKEAPVEGYLIDVVHGQQLIEVQTQHFYAIKRKMVQLIDKYLIKLVYPVAKEKWLIKLPGKIGDEPTMRKSPKHGQPCQVFGELVSFPGLIAHQNFSLDILMVDVEEVRRYTGKKPWRQSGWETVEQRLIRIVETITINEPTDLLTLFPEPLPVEFTTADLQKEAGISRWLAQKAAFCLRKAGAVRQSGKRGRFNLYKI